MEAAQVSSQGPEKAIEETVQILRIAVCLLSTELEIVGSWKDEPRNRPFVDMLG